MTLYVRIAANGKAYVTPLGVTLAEGDSVLIGTARQRRDEARPRTEVVLDTPEKLELALKGQWSGLIA